MLDAAHGYGTEQYVINMIVRMEGFIGPDIY